eukprot:GHVT01060341.1.p2 GENE.GHVT01060341.1~~GHVT01060341.1.p2  ORF type:complete len:253 (+),score=29.44 GHVT01060341.1:736-1494(+)
MAQWLLVLVALVVAASGKEAGRSNTFPCGMLQGIRSAFASSLTRVPPHDSYVVPMETHEAQPGNGERGLKIHEIPDLERPNSQLSENSFEETGTAVVHIRAPEDGRITSLTDEPMSIAPSAGGRLAVADSSDEPAEPSIGLLQLELLAELPQQALHAASTAAVAERPRARHAPRVHLSTVRSPIRPHDNSRARKFASEAGLLVDHPPALSSPSSPVELLRLGVEQPPPAETDWAQCMSTKAQQLPGRILRST